MATKPEGKVVDESQLQVNRIRVTLNSPNVKSLEKGKLFFINCHSFCELIRFPSMLGPYPCC